MIKIGLTGSIGSGKSTVAKTAAEKLGIPVFDADDTVHRLYAEDIALQDFLRGKCGPDIVADGQIDRLKLGDFMRAPANRQAWLEIEAEVHRCVWERCDEFFAAQAAAGNEVAIVDTPLLFEAGAQSRFDYTINVALPYELQKQRALARETPKLTEEEFERRYSIFMPIEERNRRADFVIDNSGELNASLLQMRACIAKMSDSSIAPAALAPSFNQAAVYVGSFDPITLGHVDVVRSAAKLPYSKLYVAIGVNPEKEDRGMFTAEERLAMIEREMDRDVRPYLPPGQEVIVTSYPGLTVDFMQSVGASLCVRGLRGGKDLEEETPMATANRGLYATALEEPATGEFTQVYFPTSDPTLQHVSSSYARDICAVRRDLELLSYVSPDVAAKMIAKRDGKKKRGPSSP